MRRQKRNLGDRAFLRGYQAGFSGRNKDSCPHAQSRSRQRWLSGWREGRADLWDGYHGAAAAQKQQLLH